MGYFGKLWFIIVTPIFLTARDGLLQLKIINIEILNKNLIATKEESTKVLNKFLEIFMLEFTFK